MVKPGAKYHLVIVFIVFSIIFFSFGVVNHFNYRTYALDLGMFNQALYQFSVGESATFTQGVNGEEMNYLCDHYSPVVILLSPLRYVFGTYTLLVVQVCALLICSYYIYLLSRLKGINEFHSVLLMILSMSSWCVYGALSYDFHANVILACLLPVLYYFFYKKSWIKFTVVLVLALMTKENAGFILFFFFLLLAVESRRDLRMTKFSLSMSVVSAMALCLTLFYLVPLNCEGLKSNVEGFYSSFGPDFSSAAVNMLASPLKVMKLFYMDAAGHIAKTKITTYWFLLLSGGIFIVLRPQFFILLLPVLLQKFLSSNSLLWDVNGHYSIEFMPVFALAAVNLVGGSSSSRIKSVLLTSSIALALFVSWRGIISRNERSNIFSPAHYHSEIERPEVLKAMEMIGDSSVISCSSELAPHFSFRKKLFVFPVIKDSEYIVLNKTSRNTYPIMSDAFSERIEQLRADSNFIIILEMEQVIVFERLENQLQMK